MIDRIIVREAVKADAEAIIIHTKKVLQENADFMGTLLEEFKITVEQEMDWIEGHRESGMLFVTESHHSIVGLLSFKLSQSKRFSHQGMLGMSVQEAYTNRGIGSLLMQELLAWSTADKRVEKVSLEVFSNNKRAIHFYRKHGFVEEGRRKKNAKLREGVYVDDIIMSQFV